MIRERVSLFCSPRSPWKKEFGPKNKRRCKCYTVYYTRLNFLYFWQFNDIQIRVSDIGWSSKKSCISRYRMRFLTNEKSPLFTNIALFSVHPSMVKFPSKLPSCIFINQQSNQLFTNAFDSTNNNHHSCHAHNLIFPFSKLIATI